MVCSFHVISTCPGYLRCQFVSDGPLQLESKQQILLRCIHFHYSLQLIIIHLDLRSTMGLIFKSKVTGLEILPTTYSVFNCHIFTKHPNDVLSSLACIGSMIELIFINNTNLLSIHRIIKFIYKKTHNVIRHHELYFKV